MSEGNLPVVEHPFGARRAQRRRDIDYMHAGHRRRHLGQREIGQAETRAMSRDSTFRESQRLHGGFRQIVDQDRRGCPLAQLLEQLPCLREISGVRVLAGRGRLRDEVPRSERAYKNSVVLVFGGEAHVVGKGRRDTQVDTAPCSFPAQEIRLHLDIAIAEQQDIDAFPGAAQILDSIASSRRPTGCDAFLHLPPVAFQHFGGIAPVRCGKSGAGGRQFFFRRFLGEDLALGQPGDRSGDDVARIGNQMADRSTIVRDAARFAEIIDQDAGFAVHRQAHVADGMDQQKTVGANGQLVNKAGAAQHHRLTRRDTADLDRPGTAFLLHAAGHCSPGASSLPSSL